LTKERTGMDRDKVADLERTREDVKAQLRRRRRREVERERESVRR
jgi:hypothetical protein